MSIFKTLLSRIFPGHDEPATLAPSRPTPPHSADSAAPSFLLAASTFAPPPSVDVAALLDGFAAANPGELDWRRSIEHLLKLLDMDSSPAARRELATELHYPGDTNNSAGMNVWLHQQVLRKLAENGGKVPVDLLD